MPKCPSEGFATSPVFGEHEGRVCLLFRKHNNRVLAILTLSATSRLREFLKKKQTLSLLRKSLKTRLVTFFHYSKNVGIAHFALFINLVSNFYSYARLCVRFRLPESTNPNSPQGNSRKSLALRVSKF